MEESRRCASRVTYDIPDVVPFSQHTSWTCEIEAFVPICLLHCLKSLYMLRCMHLCSLIGCRHANLKKKKTTHSHTPHKQSIISRIDSFLMNSISFIPWNYEWVWKKHAVSFNHAIDNTFFILLLLVKNFNDRRTRENFQWFNHRVSLVCKL